MGNPSTMSRDRVHFTVLFCYLQKKSIRDCLAETLGINLHLLTEMSRKERDLNIICRPSQFARFIILRHTKYNEPNNMACLSMKLVMPPKMDEALDVSRNPNTPQE